MMPESPQWQAMQQMAESDALQIFDEIGEFVRINGLDVRCIATDVAAERDYVSGGFYDEQEVTLTILLRDLPALPIEEQRVEYQSRDLRIKRVVKSVATVDLILGDLES